jgi:hypothetical protein
MQVPRELYIHGEPDQLATTALAICAAVSGDWSCHTDTQEYISRRKAGVEQSYGFRRAKGERRSAVDLYLLEKDKTTLYVTNIVPQERGLSIAEYNDIVDEFTDSFVQPAAARTGARVELTKAEEDLEDWMSPETAKKLRRFCALANKSTGSNHPADREWWFDFIVSAHREASKLDSTTLRQWLRESGGWDAETSDSLAGDYANARDILAHAEKQSVGV